MHRKSTYPENMHKKYGNIDISLNEGIEPSTPKLTV